MRQNAERGSFDCPLAFDQALNGWPDYMAHSVDPEAEVSSHVITAAYGETFGQSKPSAARRNHSNVMQSALQVEVS